MVILLETVLLIVMAVIGFTAMYKIMPFKKWVDKKPGFTLFPKYIATFSKPASQIEASLENMRFSKNESHIYTRGKIYGDFSANSIKLAAVIDQEHSQVKVYASFFGVLFDTGDIWQVTSDIINGQ